MFHVDVQTDGQTDRQTETDRQTHMMKTIDNLAFVPKKQV